MYIYYHNWYIFSITFTTPASYCTYEIEQFEDLEDSAIQGEIAMVSHDRIRRSRGVFTREKNKLYLKQFVEQGPGGVIQVKQSVLQKYNIAKVRFEQIFTGNPPDFPSSKKFDKLVVNGIMGKNKSNPHQFKKMPSDKKPRQETMSKYITKSDKFEGRLFYIYVRSIDFLIIFIFRYYSIENDGVL